MDTLTWITTTDREGRRAYVAPTGQVVCKDGCGPTPVTVYYAGFTSWSDPEARNDYGMVDTIREGKAWAEQDAEVNWLMEAESHNAAFLGSAV